jgi:hypothetical protein
VIANTCVLHTAGTKALGRAGGGLAVTKALKEGTGISNERLFLLARLGFLATIGAPETVGLLVDKEELVESLVLVSYSLEEQGADGSFCAIHLSRLGVIMSLRIY